MADKKYGTEAIERAELEVWPNTSPEREYEIDLEFPEFTCLCPRSGYPDFATIKVLYVPEASVVELKSFKLYLNSFRDVAISHEEITNKIFAELDAALSPRALTITGDFNPRGNLKTIIRVSSESSSGDGSKVR
jgi:7-cyano-7-deazaguanine reductase